MSEQAESMLRGSRWGANVVPHDGAWKGPPSSGAGITFATLSLSSNDSGSGAGRPASVKSFRRVCHVYVSHIIMRLSDGWPSNTIPMRSNASRSCQSAPLKTGQSDGRTGLSESAHMATSRTYFFLEWE